MQKSFDSIRLLSLFLRPDESNVRISRVRGGGSCRTRLETRSMSKNPGIHISLSICIKRRRSSSVIRVVNGRAGDGLGSQDSATNTKLDTLCRSECGTMLDNRGRERVEDRCSDRFRS